MTFAELNIGDKFSYDGDDFLKDTSLTAWEIIGGRNYKLWAFIGDEVVSKM